MHILAPVLIGERELRFHRKRHFVRMIIKNKQGEFPFSGCRFIHDQIQKCLCPVIFQDFFRGGEEPQPFPFPVLNASSRQYIVKTCQKQFFLRFTQLPKIRLQSAQHSSRKHFFRGVKEIFCLSISLFYPHHGRITPGHAGYQRLLYFPFYLYLIRKKCFGRAMENFHPFHFQGRDFP